MTTTETTNTGAAARRATKTTINGIACDLATAERVYTGVGGGGNFEGSGFNRFDEVLYRNAEGFFFLVRPLDPDEAREWLRHPSHDDILARQLFPDDEDAE
jgi:hypothetical protein